MTTTQLFSVTSNTLQATSQEIQQIYHSPSRLHEYEWTVTPATRAPDGVEREMILVNGLFPGPILRARKGDSVKITIINRLPLFNQSTSIHFHGLHQRGTNSMDGVPGVTQCGIPSNDSLTYAFNLTQSGTFWWHSHSGMQRIDGVFGGLIVYDPEEHYVLGRDYDEEIFIVLHDYYHTPGWKNIEWYLSKDSTGYEPVPDGGLINGRGTANCDRLKHVTCTRGSTSRPTFTFERGKRYRLRILNASAISEINFSIDDHILRVIEVDSTEVEAAEVYKLTLSPGQRYSVIVEADSILKAVYMRARLQSTCFKYRPIGFDPDFTATIYYATPGFGQFFDHLVKRVAPQSVEWQDAIPPSECVDLDVSALKPLNPIAVPDAGMSIQISPKNMLLDRVYQAPYGFINRTSFMPAIGAPNLQVALGLVDAADTVMVPTVSARRNTKFWGGDQLVVDIPLGSVVELIINNSDEGEHPFHLHGHDFWVLRTYEEKHAGIGKWFPQYAAEYNLDNPIRRDTVTVPRLGHVVIRFIADSPGIWALHCHIAWHVAGGMMMQFNVAGVARDVVTEEMVEHCRVERELGSRLLRPLPGDAQRAKAGHKPMHDGSPSR
ncbi:Cupredoxin [Limtongia smithiae]|uniref:Cupredoxin n=1 Tax=Limtongia smithiae TaxID=1125753 RepID=UPI0034CD0FEA